MPKPGPRTTNQYSTEFKASAVAMSLEQGVLVQDVARELAIHPFMLSRWRKEAREGRFDVRKKQELDQETLAELKALRKLKKQYEQLKWEHDVLKKAIAFTSTQRQTNSPSSNTPSKGKK